MVQRDLCAKPQAHHAPEINKGQKRKSRSCWKKASLACFETTHRLLPILQYHEMLVFHPQTMK